MSGGMGLEAAIAAAANHYLLVGRAELHKQHTPKTHGGVFTGRAPVDFRGWHLDDDGHRAPLVIEAKECELERVPFSEKYIKQHQVEAIADNVKRGIATWLVVDMTAYREIYVVPGAAIVAFTAAPWRSSLSLAWLRAEGFVAKESDRDNPKKRAVWFLDYAPHEFRVAATFKNLEDRAEHGDKVVELYPASRLTQGAAALTLRELLASKPGRDATDLERLRWQDKFSAWELERNYKEARRVAARTRRKGWGSR